MTREIADYGTWKSPISAEILASKSVSIAEVVVNQNNGRIFYSESRPDEGGRFTIVEHAGGAHKDILPKEYNVTSKVHEYGGGALAISPLGLLIFTDANTSGVFSLNPDSGDIVSLVEADRDVRYADFDVHPTNPKWILAIREDHRSQPVQNCVVTINTDTKQSSVVASGADFYIHPKFNPEGQRICWVEWRFPDMPWNGTELFVADWIDGEIENAKLIAGKPREESISQPRWGVDSSLFFASDKTGYWQIYHLGKNAKAPKLIALEGMEESEFSNPEWFLGSCSYIQLSTRVLIAGYTKNATTRLAMIDIVSETYITPDWPLLSPMADTVKRISHSEFIVLGRTDVSPQALSIINIDPGTTRTIKSFETGLPSSIFSKTRHISFPQVCGGDKQSHCLFTPPHNPDYDGPPGKLPPLIVSVHGGPTAHAAAGLQLRIQYWTSRGFAVAQLNFTGSSGYGRAYRDRMIGKWGVIDIADAASCVSYLAKEGLINGARAGIRGGSGGGYATLQGLCAFPDVWRGGVSEYGVSDLKMLAKETHKFESQYLQGLLFGDGEEDEAVYRERSPLYNAEKIKAPLLLLQGTDDKVVPPNQAQEMERIIKNNGGKVKLIFFQGEGHGFRIGKNIWRAVEKEEGWWAKELVN